MCRVICKIVVYILVQKIKDGTIKTPSIDFGVTPKEGSPILEYDLNLIILTYRKNSNTIKETTIGSL